MKEPYTTMEMRLMENHLVFMPHLFDSGTQEKPIIYFVEVNQLENKILTEATKINLEISQEWNVMGIQHVNGKNRV
jgi:hypothetical protein